MTAPMPSAGELLAGRARVLVTGGAGFIGGAVVRRLLNTSEALVFNLDKLGYASDLTSIGEHPRHRFLQVDLADADATAAAVAAADPDLVLHLAAESHVDRSIEGPAAFLESNVLGTFQLLQAVRDHWQRLSPQRQQAFRLLHISTDEVFGSLGPEGRFSETTPYDPRSPYSASKAASDHLVRAWHHTYGLPVVLTNCSNNYGPWQFPEKLIPVVILKAAAGEPIPLYGDGANVRDWLFVEDHVDALLLAATRPAGPELLRRGLDRSGHAQRAQQPRGGRGDLRPARSAPAPGRSPQPADHQRHRPPRPRPPLWDRPDPHRHRAGLAAAPWLCRGVGLDRGLVPRSDPLVQHGAPACGLWGSAARPGLTGGTPVVHAGRVGVNAVLRM